MQIVLLGKYIQVIDSCFFQQENEALVWQCRRRLPFAFAKKEAKRLTKKTPPSNSFLSGHPHMA